MIAKCAFLASIIVSVVLFLVLLYQGVQNYNRTHDARQSLWWLGAAAVAILSGLLSAICFGMHSAPFEPGKVTENNVIAAYVSSLLSLPAGLGWVWSSGFIRYDASPGRQVDTTAQSFLLFWLASNIVVAACVIEPLFRSGYDTHRIGFAGFVGLATFMTLSILLAARLYERAGRQSRRDVLRLVGTCMLASALLAAGLQTGAEAIDSLMQSSYTRLNAWNIAIVLYPVWIAFLCGTSLVLSYLGGRQVMTVLARL